MIYSTAIALSFQRSFLQGSCTLASPLRPLIPCVFRFMFSPLRSFFGSLALAFLHIPLCHLFIASFIASLRTLASYTTLICPPTATATATAAPPVSCFRPSPCHCPRKQLHLRLNLLLVRIRILVLVLVLVPVLLATACALFWLMEIFLRQVFREDLQHLQKTEVNVALEVVRISAKFLGQRWANPRAESVLFQFKILNTICYLNVETVLERKLNKRLSISSILCRYSYR